MSDKIHFLLPQVVAPINNLIDTVPFDMHCYSLDWHPRYPTQYMCTCTVHKTDSCHSDHVSFIDNIHLHTLDPDSKIQDHTKAELYQTVVFSGPPKTEQVCMLL